LFAKEEGRTAMTDKYQRQIDDEFEEYRRLPHKADFRNLKLCNITHTLKEIGSKLKEMEKKHAKSPNS